MINRKSNTYQDAGVNIDAGNRLVEEIKPAIKSTYQPGAIGSIGGFGGLFQPDLSVYKEPILVAGTDGVGTKLRLAIELGILDTVGIDLVAMCVNDVIVQGAKPLFFLDYYSCGKLNIENATKVINGIASGCKEAGAALIGGETAEMPGMYAKKDFDLAGFCVGIVDKSNLIDGSKIKASDSVIGLASSGPHSNGYSLIRKVLEEYRKNNKKDWEGINLDKALIEPTRIYAKALLNLAEKISINGMAHITGGGITENLARVLPATFDANINLNLWERPKVFDWLQSAGNISQNEMLKTFNCGIGMMLIIPNQEANQAIDLLESYGETAFKVGEIISGAGKVKILS
ncbi:MAG: phosphoribosylformylglycinamidine cyclo-ligase [Pseudomonadota bacterium]|nr:phosphoribosylformylglycinamidine cyclo-ligase [Pseudomonadota bacterium]